jgi:aquaporin Z
MTGEFPAAAASAPASAGRDRIAAVVHARHGARIAGLLDREPDWARDFTDLSYEWRRLFSEVFGTFFLVLAGTGAPVVDQASHGQVGVSRW